MYSPLKQRITGAIVIISLIVIFVPMILTDKGEQFLTQSGSNVPPLPSYEIQVPKLELPASIPEPPQPSEEPEQETEVTPEVAVADEPPAQASAQSAASSADKSKDQAEFAKQESPSVAEPAPPKQVEKPAKVEDPVSGWVVQLGSFSKQANAERLRDKVRKKGYATFIVTVENKKGASYRVRVGPELSKARAEQLKVELNKAFKLKGLVMEFP